MYLSHVRISNFRNFKDLNVSLTRNAVIVGENRVGKSNFLFALRLVLDSSLSDAGRQLKLTDICDACDLADDPEIQIDLDFKEFESDQALLALLTDYRIASDHTTVRLSYVLRRRADAPMPATSDSDFEFKVLGGGDETRHIRPDVRRRVALDLLPALRDAESELGSWRGSPLRPLLEEAIGLVTTADIAGVSTDLESATTKLKSLKPIKDLEDTLRQRIVDLSGPKQDIDARLGFTPTDPMRLFRSIGLFIDDGKRGLSEASVGSANLALLALKLASFSWKRTKKERNYTVLCVEEPEAHLHPHLQRTVFQKLFNEKDEFQSLVLTTHSPIIASVAPIAQQRTFPTAALSPNRPFRAFFAMCTERRTRARSRRWPAARIQMVKPLNRDRQVKLRCCISENLTVRDVDSDKPAYWSARDQDRRLRRAFLIFGPPAPNASRAFLIHPQNRKQSYSSQARETEASDTDRLPATARARWFGPVR